MGDARTQLSQGLTFQDPFPPPFSPFEEAKRCFHIITIRRQDSILSIEGRIPFFREKAAWEKRASTHITKGLSDCSQQICFRKCLADAALKQLPRKSFAAADPGDPQTKLMISEEEGGSKSCVCGSSLGLLKERLRSGGGNT